MIHRKDMPMLTDWQIKAGGILSRLARPDTVLHFIGDVYNNPAFTVGKSITTSRVLAFHAHRRLLLTQNTLYRLGPMEHIFKQWLKTEKLKISDYNFNVHLIDDKIRTGNL